MIIEFPKDEIINAALSHSDNLWFAVDMNGCVILANSMEGDIPPFVKDAMPEKHNILHWYF